MSQSSFGAYKRVFMLGIDGMGAFNSKTSTPAMDKLFANGATTYQALASRPTISGQCWTSMLTGATPEVHGLSNAEMHPIPELPTIFGMVRKAYPDAETAAFTDWSPIAYQIISPTGGASHLDAGHDDELVERILTYLDDHDPKLLFIQFDSVDGAGHTFGYGFPGHLERITHVDGLLGRLVAKYEDKGWFDETLFIVTADHGGTPARGHGGWTVAEREVFLGVAGKTIRKGQIGEVCMRDFPSLVLWALGVKAPEFNPKGYAAQMPLGVFDGEGVTNREQVVPSANIHETKPEPAAGSADTLDHFIDADKIRMHINFENGFEDVSGHCKVSLASGEVKLYSNGVYGQCGEFGKGSLNVEGCTHGDVFTICAWHSIPANSSGWIDLFTTRDDVHRSFTFAGLDSGMGIFLKEPDQGQTYRLDIDPHLTEDTDDKINLWNHFMYVVDIPNRTIRGYVDFEFYGEKVIGEDISAYFDFSTMKIAGEQADEHVLRMFDDLLLIDGAVDPAVLKKYYKM